MTTILSNVDLNIIIIFGLIILTIAVLNLQYNGVCDRNRGQNIENFSQNSTNNEALQDIASLYNKENMSISNLNVTTSLNANSFNLLPRGIIVAWTGTSPPSGWTLCDGKGGAPDLRGKFIYGFGSGRGRKMNAQGGVETVALSEAQMPRHRHGIIPFGDNDGKCSKKNSKSCGLQSSDGHTDDRIYTDRKSVV